MKLDEGRTKHPSSHSTRARPPDTELSRSTDIPENDVLDGI